MGTVWGIVVAAGLGSRYGGPKQFDDLGGRPVIDWAVDAARAACDGVVVVLPDVGHRLARYIGAEEGLQTISGGATRSASVRAGLAAVPEAATVVVVHDAARPLASASLFGRVLAAIDQGADAAVPVVPVVDTLKRLAGERVLETVDRSDLVAVQTPQAFSASMLRRAHAGGDEATDDATLVEALGGLVVAVQGERHNLKLTVPEDLGLVRRLVASPP